MTEREFKKRFKKLQQRHTAGNISSLDFGRGVRELCEEWQKDHADLPLGFWDSSHLN